MTFTRDAPVTTRPGKPPKKNRGKRVAVIGLGIITALFAAGLVKQLIAPPDPTPEPPTAAAGVPDPAMGQDGQSPTTNQPAPAGPSCGGWTNPPTGTTPDTTTPPTHWDLVGGMAAPSSKDAGPAHTTHGIRSCYTHTPTGALFAAANYLAQIQDPENTPESELALAETVMVDGPAKAGIIGQLKHPVRESIPGADVRAAFTAFHFVSYTDTTALIDIANAWNGHLDAAVYTLQFQRGTWLLDPPASGRFDMRELPVQDARYWIPWSAS